MTYRQLSRASRVGECSKLFIVFFLRALHFFVEKESYFTRL
jgi:hypothetical protein